MLLSPGIETKETSLQTTVVNSSTGRAATVGKFRWGPAFEISQVISEVDLVDRFYSPNDATAASFFSAVNFLKYGNDLRLVRIVDHLKAKNASVFLDTITAKLTVERAVNYNVGDTITIKCISQVIPNCVGHITEVDANKRPTKFYIPSGEIIKFAKDAGKLSEDGTLTDFTAEIDGSNGGTGATFSELKVMIDSSIYFPNDSESVGALTAPTAQGKDVPRSFADLCKDFFMPSICARFPGEYASDIEVEIGSYADWQYKAPTHGGGSDKGKPDGVVSMPIFPYGGIRKTNFRSFFQYGPQNENQYAFIVRRGDEVLETMILSTKYGDTDIYGNNIYLDDYFQNGRSQYLTGTSEVFPKNFSGVVALGGGLSGNTTLTAGAWQMGWDLFADRHQTQVNLLIAGSCASESDEIASTVQKHVNDIATARQDCVAFISPPRGLIVGYPVAQAIDNIVSWRRGVDAAGTAVDNNMNINSTFAFIDGNFKFQYDKYNDVNRWVPLAADIAGLCARTDQVAQPWMSPAGFNRGQIQGVIKLAIDTRQSHRDALYQEAVNPVVSFAGQGILLYGDKTATSQPSPFDRINVRRLFNLLKSSIGRTAQYKLFELNDAFTRMSFRSEVNGYLDGIKSLGGMYDFRVVCDSSNNTPSVVDRNEFIATILVKPARSINFITLNFVATSTGADFDEIVGKA